MAAPGAGVASAAFYLVKTMFTALGALRIISELVFKDILETGLVIREILVELIERIRHVFIVRYTLLAVKK